MTMFFLVRPDWLPRASTACTHTHTHTHVQTSHTDACVCIPGGSVPSHNRHAHLAALSPTGHPGLRALQWCDCVWYAAVCVCVCVSADSIPTWTTSMPSVTLPNTTCLPAHTHTHTHTHTRSHTARLDIIILPLASQRRLQTVIAVGVLARASNTQPFIVQRKCAGATNSIA